MKSGAQTSRLSVFLKGQFLKDRRHYIYLIIYIAHFFLIFFDFFPYLSEINAWDEALYINWGRFLADGKLPSFAQNPLLAVFYVLLYLPFSRSPYWMVWICSIGRIILFFLIWLGSYLAAREISSRLDLTVFLCLLLVMPLTSEVLANPSDAMFTAMSGFALFHFIAYLNSNHAMNLNLSSLFVGLAALARNDGFILFGIFTALSFIVTCGKNHAWKSFLLGWIPFLGLVGGYILIYGIFTGTFSTGTVQRSYIAFEQGHEILYEGSGAHSHTVDAMLDARENFGSPEENNYSIIRAIHHNPSVYFSRVRLILNKLPKQALLVYNKKMAVPLFLSAIVGIFFLFRKKDFHLLLLLAAWPAYLLVYFLTFFREGYLRTPFLPVFLLAAIGMTAFFNQLDKKKVSWGAASVLSLIMITGLVLNKLAIFYGSFLTLVGIWMVIGLRKNFTEPPHIRSYSLVVMLIVGLILHGNYSSPRIRQLGINADERAAVYLMENFPPGTKVGAGYPSVVWMAKRDFLSITGADVPAFEDSAGFHQWLIKEGIQAIYLDYSISNLAPHYWELIQQESGTGLKAVFNENNGSNRIYVVLDKP